MFNKLNIKKLSNPKQYYITAIQSLLSAKLDKSTKIYIVTGYYRIIGEDSGNVTKIIIETNEDEKTYTIYPEEYINNKGLKNIKINDSLNFQKEDISKNDYNQFTYKNVSDRDMAAEYFEQFREFINYYPDLAYEKLNQEYLSKRFGDKNNFNNYIELNKFKLVLMNINEYKVESKDNYRDYICTDQYNNVYTFRQTNGITNYTVFLDNYTVMAEYDIKYYNNLSNEDKAVYNLSTFRQMLNNKDYSAIYNVLDSTFKNNNFSNVNNLQDYLKNHIYDLNYINIMDKNKEENGYYVFNCELQNIRNNSETRNMVIVINSTEGTNFTMSFSFNESSE